MNWIAWDGFSFHSNEHNTGKRKPTKWEKILAIFPNKVLISRSNINKELILLTTKNQRSPNNKWTNKSSI